MADEFVLWGTHPRYANGVPIKVEIGTLADCRQEQRYRERLGGWVFEIKPKSTHDQAAADFLWQAGAPNYIALAFGDYVARTNWASYSHAVNHFWYDELGQQLRHTRGQAPEMWPGKFDGAPCPA